MPRAVSYTHLDVYKRQAYHHAKAKRLENISRRLDRFAATLFKIAVAAVAAWLLMRAGAALHWLPHAWPQATAKVFAFLGVCLLYTSTCPLRCTD